LSAFQEHLRCPRVGLQVFINEGMEKDGSLYLFTLRLVPLFPFFLVNLLMGLTPIRTLRYYWVSQLACWPARWCMSTPAPNWPRSPACRALCRRACCCRLRCWGVSHGGQEVLAIFAQPPGLRQLAAPKKFDRNLVVIGGGAAGLVTSYIAAAVKAKVTLVEAHKMGGDCLNYGCVPSKALIKSARVAHQMRHAENYGLTATDPQFSFKAGDGRVHEVIAAVAPHDSVERYTAWAWRCCRATPRSSTPGRWKSS
jgi:hypothetical protein